MLFQYIITPRSQLNIGSVTALASIAQRGYYSNSPTLKNLDSIQKAVAAAATTELNRLIASDTFAKVLTLHAEICSIG
jgi:hypothetical protein